MRNVQIICDLDEHTGFGHFKRSLSLAEYMAGQGINCSLEILKVTDNRYNHYIPDVFQKKNESEICIYDTHRNISSLISIEKKLQKKIVVLDNFFPDQRDISINVFNHKSPPAAPKVYCGYEYVILRNEILLVHPAESQQPYVLVCLGGADVKNMSLKFANAVIAQGKTPWVVLGPLAKGKISDFPENTKVDINPSGFLSILANAAGVICNSGGVLFESLFLDKVAWVFPQSDYELNIANDLFGRKILPGFGDVLLDFDVFKPADRLIDGRGMERIVNILSDEVSR